MTRNTTGQTPIWCGIHYLLYLRQPGEHRGLCSLQPLPDRVQPCRQRTRGLPPSGRRQPYVGAARALFTPTTRIWRIWLYDYMYRGRDNVLAACGEPVVTARFGRSGDMQRRLTYSIDTAHNQFAATWDWA